MLAPVLSIKLRPTWPLLFATPTGNELVREFKRIRAVSHALAASTTTRADNRTFRRECRSIKTTLFNRPFMSTETEHTIASVMIFIRPVAKAIGSNEVVV